MPVIEIFVSSGLDDVRKADVVDGVYQSLLSEMNVKDGAKFSFVHEFDEGDRSFPASLFGITYPSASIFVKITLNKGRSVEQKSKLYRAISERIGRSLEISTEGVVISLVEALPENWSFGGGKMQFLDAAKVSS